MLRCPITRELLKDPVVAADGHTYERSAILQWFTQSTRSPMTNIAVPSTTVYPNHALRDRKMAVRHQVAVRRQAACVQAEAARITQLTIAGMEMLRDCNIRDLDVKSTAALSKFVHCIDAPPPDATFAGMLGCLPYELTADKPYIVALCRLDGSPELISYGLDTTPPMLEGGYETLSTWQTDAPESGWARHWERDGMYTLTYYAGGTPDIQRPRRWRYGRVESPEGSTRI